MLKFSAVSVLGANRQPLRFAARPDNPGSRVRLWKQDPTVEAIGIRTSYVHTPVEAGPKDDDIVIQGMPVVKPDANNDFLLDPKKDEKGFDAVHTFAVVRQVLTMFRRALKRMGQDKPLTWQWEKGPIEVHPHAGNMENAYYSRRDKVLKFFYFSPAKGANGEKVYTSRSFDIASHEAGHAILDGLKPGFYNSWHPETGGLHESFGDLSAIFTMLSQLDLCEAVIAESKGNLHDKTFFSAMAEQFGDALGRPKGYGLRNADNKLKMSDVGKEVHDISQVFTGVIYDILADMFEDGLRLESEDPAMTLFKTGEHLLAVLVAALQQSPDQNAKYKDVAEKMIALEDNPKWKDFIVRRFIEREILGHTAASFAEAAPKALSWDKCCGTLRQDEFQSLSGQAVTEARQIRGLDKKSA